MFLQYHNLCPFLMIYSIKGMPDILTNNIERGWLCLYLSRKMHLESVNRYIIIQETRYLSQGELDVRGVRRGHRRGYPI